MSENIKRYTIGLTATSVIEYDCLASSSDEARAKAKEAANGLFSGVVISCEATWATEEEEE